MLIILLYILMLYLLYNRIKFNVNIDPFTVNNKVNNILDKLYVRSGGLNININSNSNTYIKFGEKELVKNGSNGFNIVVIDRTTEKVKYTVNIDTGTDYLKGDMLTDLIQNHIKPTDIVVIAVRRDISRLLSIESKFEFKKLGATADLTRANASYILIGSLDKQVYYEKISWEKNVFFPHIIYHHLGNWKKINYEKKIALVFGEAKNDAGNGADTEADTEETVGGVFKNNIIDTCALIAKNYGYTIFSTDGDYCYLIKDHSYRTNGTGDKFKVYFIERSIFHMDELANSNYGIRCYTEPMLRGKENIFYEGIHNANYLGGIEYTGGLFKDTIQSMMIPNDYLVLITDENNMYSQIKGPRIINNFKDNFKTAIKRIIVQNIKYRVIFWSNGDFTGFGFAQSYGEYKIPEQYQIKINSIDINLRNVKVLLYYDTEFTDLYASFINNTSDVKQIYDMDNNILIKSIKIEHLIE